MSDCTYQIIDICLKLSFALIGGGWAFWNYYHRKTSDRVRATTDMFREFFEPEMLELRVAAWDYLSEHNASTDPFPYSALWSTTDRHGKTNSKDVVFPLMRVGGFWAKLYALDSQGLVDREIGRRLFGYQFHKWSEHIAKLLADTDKHDKDDPEFLEAFRPGRLNWLLDNR